ncbi:MAG: GxxExxY protein [Flavobacteriales bacterium]|nr:GxxExxY protein [Flavobacteriales bacterium]
MTENEIARIVVDCSYTIHRGMGPGLFESVYEEVLAYELVNQGLEVERQKTIDIEWDGIKLGAGFKADIVVNGKVILELKSVDKIQPVHQKQLQTYLKLTGLKLGLLINFNERLIKDGIQRIVNGL